jgi:hypothetical protein
LSTDAVAGVDVADIFVEDSPLELSTRCEVVIGAAHEVLAPLGQLQRIFSSDGKVAGIGEHISTKIASNAHPLRPRDDLIRLLPEGSQLWSFHWQSAPPLKGYKNFFVYSHRGFPCSPAAWRPLVPLVALMSQIRKSLAANYQMTTHEKKISRSFCRFPCWNSNLAHLVVLDYPNAYFLDFVICFPGCQLP